jgi:hypothetical protein
MLYQINNWISLIRDKKIKTAKTLAPTDILHIGVKNSTVDYSYEPAVVEIQELQANIINNIPPSGVQSVTDNGNGVVNVDNTDPLNPVMQFGGVNVDAVTITGNGKPFTPLVAAYQAPAVDGVTITGDGTLGNPLVAAGGGTVKYANVIFVDSTNGNDGTGAVNDFTKPMFTINAALSLASTLSPSFTNRALIYLRKGYYGVNNQFSPTTFVDYADFYSEPGVVIQGGYGRISDQSSPAPVNVNFMGYADLYECDIFITKASTINIEVNSIINTCAAFLVIPASGTANFTLTANKISAQGLGANYGTTIRNSSNVTVNIKEQYSSPYSLFDIRNHGGRIVVNAPKLALAAGNPFGYGGNFKQVVIIRANQGGEMIINGDLVNEDPVYLGGLSAMITRTQDSWGTLRINGNIYSGDTFGVNALGSSGASRTIINGDVRSNHLIAYVARNSSVVFRNGTLMNWNNLVGVSEGYPVISMGESGSVWVENCHLHSLGLGATYPNVAAFWKDTTTATLNVYNSVYSGADALGFFIRNSVGGQPVNNVRILNCRATKPLDTNITDLLTPTGFTQDANVQSINFI